MGGGGAVGWGRGNTVRCGRCDRSNGRFALWANPGWQAGSATNSMMGGAAEVPAGDQPELAGRARHQRDEWGRRAARRRVRLVYRGQVQLDMAVLSLCRTLHELCLIKI